MTVVRAGVNQQVQIAVESTHGTAVPATKLIDAFTWTLGNKSTTKQFQGTGRQYPSASALLTEMAAGKISGPGDFAQLVYPLSSLWGSGAPALHSPSTTAFDWIWTPLLVGSYANGGKSFTVENGDPTTGDAEKYAFLMFTGFNYSFGRTQEVTIGADWIAQTFTDGVTMTASPTAVEQVPMTGAQANLYLDPTSAALGTTQLLAPLKFDYKASEYYDPYWPINRANQSFTNVIDKLKKHEITLSLEANSAGIAVRGSYLETGALAYIRVQLTGPTIDGAHSISAGMTHDMACFVTDVSEFGDEQGAYKVDYKLAIAEDTTWSPGLAQKMTLTNLVSAL